MLKFHIDTHTAYRVLHELKVPLNKWAVSPKSDHSMLYSINFEKRQLFNITRSKKPRRKLTFEQVQELLILPVEAHDEWFNLL